MFYAWLKMLGDVTTEIDGYRCSLSIYTNYVIYLACFKLDIYANERLHVQDILKREVIYYAQEHKRVGSAKT